MCAVEIEIGAGFPTPEKFLFQHVMSKPNAQRTMLGAKRWAAEDSLAADLIEEACPQDELFDRALAFAEEQSRLARGPHGRKLYMSVKNQMKGHGESQSPLPSAPLQPHSERSHQVPRPLFLPCPQHHSERSQAVAASAQ